jgi:hypothetical protein
MLYTDVGRIIISLLLGLGLATLFRKVCTDKNCIEFRGPIISDVEDHIYQYGENCYKYKIKPVKCDKSKKTVDIASPVAKPSNPLMNIINPGASSSSSESGVGGIFKYLPGSTTTS